MYPMFSQHLQTENNFKSSSAAAVLKRKISEKQSLQSHIQQTTQLPNEVVASGSGIPTHNLKGGTQNKENNTHSSNNLKMTATGFQISNSQIPNQHAPPCGPSSGLPHKGSGVNKDLKMSLANSISTTLLKQTSQISGSQQRKSSTTISQRPQKFSISIQNRESSASGQDILSDDRNQSSSHQKKQSLQQTNGSLMPPFKMHNNPLTQTTQASSTKALPIKHTQTIQAQIASTQAVSSQQKQHQNSGSKGNLNKDLINVKVLQLTMNSKGNPNQQQQHQHPQPNQQQHIQATMVNGAQNNRYGQIVMTSARRTESTSIQGGKRDKKVIDYLSGNSQTRENSNTASAQHHHHHHHHNIYPPSDDSEKNKNILNQLSHQQQLYHIQMPIQQQQQQQSSSQPFNNSDMILHTNGSLSSNPSNPNNSSCGSMMGLKYQQMNQKNNQNYHQEQQSSQNPIAYTISQRQGSMQQPQYNSNSSFSQNIHAQQPQQTNQQINHNQQFEGASLMTNMVLADQEMLRELMNNRGSTKNASKTTSNYFMAHQGKALLKKGSQESSQLQQQIQQIQHHLHNPQQQQPQQDLLQDKVEFDNMGASSLHHISQQLQQLESEELDEAPVVPHNHQQMQQKYSKRVGISVSAVPDISKLSSLINKTNGIKRVGIDVSAHKAMIESKKHSVVNQQHQVSQPQSAKGNKGSSSIISTFSQAIVGKQNSDREIGPSKPAQSSLSLPKTTNQITLEQNNMNSNISHGNTILKESSIQQKEQPQKSRLHQQKIQSFYQQNSQNQYYIGNFSLQQFNTMPANHPQGLQISSDSHQLNPSTKAKNSTAIIIPTSYVSKTSNQSNEQSSSIIESQREYKSSEFSEHKSPQMSLFYSNPKSLAENYLTNYNNPSKNLITSSKYSTQIQQPLPLLQHQTQIQNNSSNQQNISIAQNPHSHHFKQPSASQIKEKGQNFSQIGNISNHYNLTQQNLQKEDIFFTNKSERVLYNNYANANHNVGQGVSAVHHEEKAGFQSERFNYQLAQQILSQNYNLQTHKESEHFKSKVSPSSNLKTAMQMSQHAPKMPAASLLPQQQQYNFKKGIENNQCEDKNSANKYYYSQVSSNDGEKKFSNLLGTTGMSNHSTTAINNVNNQSIGNAHCNPAGQKSLLMGGGSHLKSNIQSMLISSGSKSTTHANATNTGDLGGIYSGNSNVNLPKEEKLNNSNSSSNLQGLHHLQCQTSGNQVYRQDNQKNQTASIGTGNVSSQGAQLSMNSQLLHANPLNQQSNQTSSNTNNGNGNLLSTAIKSETTQFSNFSSDSPLICNENLSGILTNRFEDNSQFKNYLSSKSNNISANASNNNHNINTVHLISSNKEPNVNPTNAVSIPEISIFQANQTSSASQSSNQGGFSSSNNQTNQNEGICRPAHKKTLSNHLINKWSAICKVATEGSSHFILNSSNISNNNNNYNTKESYSLPSNNQPIENKLKEEEVKQGEVEFDLEKSTETHHSITEAVRVDSSNSSAQRMKKLQLLKLQEELDNFKPDNIKTELPSYFEKFQNLQDIIYIPNPDYFDNQKEITCMMRCILIDWMMEVCMELQMKRDTLYLSMNYVDRYLSLTNDISKSKLQLIGVVSLFIAAKIEEIFPPTILDFAKSADDGYSIPEIVETELDMLKLFEWKLNPPTQNIWMNFYTDCWDIFVRASFDKPDKHEKKFVQDQKLTNKNYIIMYRQPDQRSYSHYRQIAQIMDLMQLDVNILRFETRMIIASLMYLQLGIYYKQFAKQQVHSSFNEKYLFANSLNSFNEFFNSFITQYFQFFLIDLLPTLQYVSTFFDIEYNYALPLAANQKDSNSSELFYQDFLSFQTYFPNGIDYIRKRYCS